MIQIAKSSMRLTPGSATTHFFKACGRSSAARLISLTIFFGLR